MTERLHPTQRIVLAAVRAGRHFALALVVTTGLTGCHKKVAPFVLPSGTLAPVELETLPPPDSPAEIAELPPPELGPLPEPLPAKPVPRRRPTPKEDTQLPTQQVAEAEPAALAIGSLSTGGDAAPQSQQQAQELIASILKRIAALPAKTADAQKRQIKQVHNFVDQAQKALASGDAEGARNLAGKAALLMDDIEKK